MEKSTQSIKIGFVGFYKIYYYIIDRLALDADAYIY